MVERDINQANKILNTDSVTHRRLQTVVTQGFLLEFWFPGRFMIDQPSGWYLVMLKLMWYCDIYWVISMNFYIYLVMTLRDHMVAYMKSVLCIHLFSPLCQQYQWVKHVLRRSRSQYMFLFCLLFYGDRLSVHLSAHFVIL